MGLVRVAYMLLIVSHPIQGKTLTMLALIIATNKDVPPSSSKSTLIGAGSEGCEAERSNPALP
jgi:hypothetical protein